MSASTWIMPVSCSGLEPASSAAVMLWLSAVTLPVPRRRGAAGAAGVADRGDRVADRDRVGVPSFAVLSPDASDSCSTATSSVASVPTTLAVYDWPVLTTVTVICVAPSTTWLLVRISPFEVSTMPVPAASAWP